VREKGTEEREKEYGKYATKCDKEAGYTAPYGNY
jgi:hypothetical protein